MPRGDGGRRGLDILMVLPDAFGGRGGIAKFNRDLLTALASHPATDRVTALPRYVVEPVGELPARLDYRRAAAFGKAAFLLSELALLAQPRWYDLVICGHIRLMPLIELLRLRGVPQLGLVIHGVDVWDPFGGSLVWRGLKRLDWFLSVSEVTRQRFCAWSGVATERGRIIPNCVDRTQFTPGPKRADLVARYKLAGRTVLMSLGRLDARERYKGVDQVIEALPGLLATHPDLVYLVCGDGSDRARLEAKAKGLGLGERVIFAGYVPEAEKLDHYRLADLFLLAGWGEGFGIVLLEALACGVPVVASSLDGSREAVADGALGVVVDPRDPADLARGIEEGLARPRGVVPDGLEQFTYPAFEARVHRLIVDPLLAGSPLAERAGEGRP